MHLIKKLAYENIKLYFYIREIGLKDQAGVELGLTTRLRRLACTAGIS